MTYARPGILFACSSLAVALAALLATSRCQQEQNFKVPHLLLISIDSLRADHLACYGYSRVTSPHLEQLAKEGVLFEDVMAETSWTLPTHATMMTGLTSNVHQVFFDGASIPDEYPTLADTLAAAGYANYGVWSGPYLHPLFGFGQGFAEDHYVGVLGETAFDREGFSFQDPEDFQARNQTNRLAHRKVTSPEVTAQGLAFLEEHLQHTPDQPFFLFLHYFDVHYDYVPPKEYWRRFDADYDGPSNGRNFLKDPQMNADLSERERQHLLARYDGEILWTDEHIGRVLEFLETSGLKDDTVIAVISDHGDEFWEHGNKGHRNTLYQEVLHVPWMIRYPNTIEPGTRISEPAHHMDVMPTLLGLLNVAAPSTVMGQDWSHQTWGEESLSARPLVARLIETDGQLSALRWNDRKLLVYQADGDTQQSELYDLNLDWQERQPLDDSELPQIERMLDHFQAQEADLRQALPAVTERKMELPDALYEELRALGYVE